MILHVLTEELSCKKALQCFLPKITVRGYEQQVISFGSKQKMLKELPARLAAYRQMIERGKDVRLVLLIDRDGDDCKQLKRELEQLACGAGLTTKNAPERHGRFDTLTRIIIEELEAWFLGDPAALCKAFKSLPGATRLKAPKNPDAIRGGTWETLHRLLKQHGIYTGTYPKIEAASRIAPHLNPDCNASASFNMFVSGIKALLEQNP